MNRVSRYRRRKRDAWETRTFACFQRSSRGYLRDLRVEVVVMDRHPELRRLAAALLEAVIADQEQTEEKPKEEQHEDHT